MFLSVVTALTEQSFLHKPNALYSHLTKNSKMIWNAISYWICSSTFVTTIRAHEQCWETECSFKTTALVIQGCECGTWRTGGTKSTLGKQKAPLSGYRCANHCTWSAKSFQQTCWTCLTLMLEHCDTPATSSHLWRSPITFQDLRARRRVSEKRYSMYRSCKELIWKSSVSAMEWVDIDCNLPDPAPMCWFKWLHDLPKHTLLHLLLPWHSSAYRWPNLKQ